MPAEADVTDRSEMKRIVLTGGGTAGHVTPNMALVPELRNQGFEVHYIGSYDGIEKQLIEELDVPYYGIATGKLRRYFDVKNFTDPIRVVKGFAEASSLVKKIKPNVVFSKGGFVAVPVAMAAKRHKVPFVLHESDLSPGLANRICLPYAKKVCVNFPETVNRIPKNNAVLTGTPIRRELFHGNRLKGLDFCGFTANKPVILVVGGSQGSVAINEAVRNALDSLLDRFQVAHLCGEDKVDEEWKGKKGYVQFEYVKKELRDLIDMADVVVSRAGANMICELLALGKPNVLIPLPRTASRGDQILNARSFEKQGFSYVLAEEELTTERLVQGIEEVYGKREEYHNVMKESRMWNSIERIVAIVGECVGQS